MLNRQLPQYRSTHEFTGFSMWPTLRPGDGLVVQPYCAAESVCRGDVVLFSDPIRRTHVVHRVVVIDRQGIRMQGDHNARMDPAILQPTDIQGKVVMIVRKDKTLRIRHGMAGRLIGWLRRERRSIAVQFCRAGSPVYRWCVRTGIFRLPPRWLRLQIVGFQRPHGAQIVARFWRRWTIGVFCHERQRWEIRRPWRLLIDERFLADFVKEFDKTIFNNQQCASQTTL